MRYLCFKWSKFLNNYHEFKFEVKMNIGQKAFPSFLSFSMFPRDFPVYSTLLLVKKESFSTWRCFWYFRGKRKRDSLHIVVVCTKTCSPCTREEKTAQNVQWRPMHCWLGYCVAIPLTRSEKTLDFYLYLHSPMTWIPPRDPKMADPWNSLTSQLLGLNPGEIWDERIKAKAALTHLGLFSEDTFGFIWKS